MGLGPGRPHTDGIERGHEGEGAADQVVGRAGADEAHVVLGDADVAEHLGHDRHEHLDLVALVLAPHVVVLGEGHDAHRPRARDQLGEAAHRYSLYVS